MPLQNRENQKVVTTTIDKTDYLYMRANGIKPAWAIRAFVRDHKVNNNAPDADFSVRELRRKWEAMRELHLETVKKLKKAVGEEKAHEILNG